MFAKPVKKPASQVPKQKALSKPKTVSVKAGLKAPTTKKCRPDGGGLKPKPPPRPDPGYSLYSSDSEDQLSSAYREMDTCEKILTHLRHKQKVSGHPKGKKKKKNSGSPLPKALNDIVPGSGVTVDPSTGIPVGAVEYLRHLHAQSSTSHPEFNYRLASSTPDPDKHQSELSSQRQSGVQPDSFSCDVPVRDISGVSAVPPTTNHLQNMADMVDIYRRLEFNKYQQLREVAALAELEKLKVTSQPDKSQGHSQGQSERSQTSQQTEQRQSNPGVQFDRLVPSSSSGFTPVQLSCNTSQEKFVPPQVEFQLRNSQTDSFEFVDNNPRLSNNSNPTAFLPYLNRESLGFLPKGWLPSEQHPYLEGSPSQQPDAFVAMETAVDDLQLSGVANGEEGRKDMPLSSRTDQSDMSGGTDYAVVTRKESDVGNQVQAGVGGEVVLEKQNGLYQLHQKSAEGGNDAGEKEAEQKKDIQFSIHEEPERDVPRSNTAGPKSTSGSSEGTFTIDAKGNVSHSLSEATTSTPRNQNHSGVGSTGGQSGRLIFIPHDSSSQSVIGYIPVPGPTGPQMWTTPVQPGSVVSSGPSQGPSQAGPALQEASGSGYHSVAHAQAIAAGDVGVRKLRYLLKELKECNKVSKDVEITRLVNDIEEAVNAIPQLALTFNLQTEIDLALQPLRSENSQLRRKCRLLNQQLKEKEEAPKDVNFEILHLQTSNEKLQKALREEQNVKTRLAAEVQFVLAEIHKMKIEKSKLIADISERETKELKFRQETLLETQKLRHEIDLFKKDKDTTESGLERAERENHILQVTLHQRDAEVARQQEVIETMKESIADLLRELEQSRTEDRTWNHNQSYGLSRLLRIVEEEGSVYDRERAPQQTYKKRVVTPERTTRKVLDTSGMSSSSTPRLTRAALAFHDWKHPQPLIGPGPDGRQGPASESELDTLVELQRKERQRSPTRDRQGHRRTSSSSPVRVQQDWGCGLQHQRTTAFPAAGKILFKDRDSKRGENGQNEHKRNRAKSGSRLEDSNVSKERSRPVNGGYERSRERQREVPSVLTRPRVQGEAQERSEVSVEQSRYSVTDYFRKYPQSSQSLSKEGEKDSGRPMMGRVFPSPTKTDFRTSSQIDDRTLRSFEGSPKRNINTLTLFKGVNCDQTISAIPDDDDAISSVSMTSITTANTVDERKFRNGIATLDANIAKLQQALQKTKSMLT